MADGARRGRAPIDIEEFIVAAIGMEAGRQDAGLAVLTFKHDGAGTITEQNAGRAVFPIKDAAEGFGANDERALHIARADHRVSNRERIEEA